MVLVIGKNMRLCLYMCIILVQKAIVWHVAPVAAHVKSALVISFDADKAHQPANKY